MLQLRTYTSLRPNQLSDSAYPAHGPPPVGVPLPSRSPQKSSKSFIFLDSSTYLPNMQLGWDRSVKFCLGCFQVCIPYPITIHISLHPSRAVYYFDTTGSTKPGFATTANSGLCSSSTLKETTSPFNPTKPLLHTYPIIFHHPHAHQLYVFSPPIYRLLFVCHHSEARPNPGLSSKVSS